MGGCQDYDPFWGTLNIRCRTIIGIQKGAIILTTAHIYIYICIYIYVYIYVDLSSVVLYDWYVCVCV